MQITAEPADVERRLVALLNGQRRPGIHRAIRLTDWKQRDANRGVLRLHPRLARYKVTVLPLSKKDTLFLGRLSVDPGTPATASAANEGASRSAER